LNDEVFLAALGGLLHDVGKLALRAGETPSQTWDDEAQALYRYKHALLSADAAVRLLPAPWQEALAGAALHHRPEGRLATLVALGDRLSSGEREKREGSAPERLEAVLTRVRLSDDQSTAKPAYLPLRPLCVDKDTIFPTCDAPGGSLRDAYAALWQGLSNQLRELRNIAEGEGVDRRAYLDTLLDVMRTFTWCVPSAAYRAVPDVSLYDHSRMTAALAACLCWRTDDELAELLTEPGRSEEVVALLVGGDVSGVQDFLYTVTPRGAASALRGRSFYLQMLTDAVVGYLLRRLGLPPTNVVYASGGRFFLLAPPEAKDQLAEAQRYVSRVLLRHHGGDLYVALAGEPLSGRDFYEGRMANKWAGVAASLRLGKERRFLELGADLHHLLFEPWRDQGNQQRECGVCHHEHADVRPDGETEVLKCPACRAYEQYGDGLRRAKYLALIDVEPAFDGDDGPAGTPDDVLAALGLRLRLPSAPGEVDVEGERVRILALTDEARKDLGPGPRTSVGRRFLVNVTPEREGKIKTTDKLAEASRGISRLGALRMDVDNLGRIFSVGLGKLASLSRLAQLSFAISLYFEGWVETLAREFNPPDGDHRVYSIYSGGDDLFFVGSWDALADLARAIRRDFTVYCAGHPDLHVSGGMVLVGERYPLYQAADDAGKAEDQAKTRPGKDAFTFLGRTLPWETVERAAGLAGRLTDLVESGCVSHALLRLLMRTQEAHEEVARRRARLGADRTADGAPQAYYGPWIPRAEYMLARLAQRHPKAENELNAIRALLREDDYRGVTWVGLAARWAELLTRQRRNKNGG